MPGPIVCSMCDKTGRATARAKNTAPSAKDRIRCGSAPTAYTIVRTAGKRAT